MSRVRERRDRNRHSRRGVTLMETVAAIVLLAIAVPPMLWSLRDAQYKRSDAVLSSRARWMVVEAIEDVLADRHSQTRGWDYLIPSNYAPEPAVPGFGAFSRTVQIVETGADLVSSGTGYKTITVEVQWTDSTGTSRSLAISTVVTELS